jgi:hypothetical protein
MRANIRFREDSRGVIKISAVSIETAGSKLCNDYLDFLGEYGAICQTTLARESGPQGRLFEKKPRVENLVFFRIQLTGNN